MLGFVMSQDLFKNFVVAESVDTWTYRCVVGGGEEAGGGEDAQGADAYAGIAAESGFDGAAAALPDLYAMLHGLALRNELQKRAA